MGIESPVHLVFIAIVALIVLGPKRLPDMARALGQGIREFRGSLEEGANPSQPPPPAPDGQPQQQRPAVQATAQAAPAAEAPDARGGHGSAQPPAE